MHRSQRSPLRRLRLKRLRALLAYLRTLRQRLGFVTRKELVAKLVHGTAGTELQKGEYRELPQVPGVWGLIRLEGNSLPSFTYHVFDEHKDIYDFVTVTADVALPDKITFSCTAPDHGNVALKSWYTRPFYSLARNLFQYFPLLPGRDGPKELMDGKQKLVETDQGREAQGT